MRVMVIVKASEDSEADVLPSRELIEAMGKYNEELVKAGIMLAADGLRSSSKGKRMKFSGDLGSSVPPNLSLWIFHNFNEAQETI